MNVGVIVMMMLVFLIMGLICHHSDKVDGMKQWNGVKEPEEGKDISEPVITFVNLVKNNPRRFKVSVDKDCALENYTIKDRRSDFEGSYYPPVVASGGSSHTCWELSRWYNNKDIALTSDEKTFIEEELIFPYIELLKASDRDWETTTGG